MAKIKKIKLDGTTYDICDADALHSHQTIKQDGVTGATANRYGVCSTAVGTAAKAVSITTGTFSLDTGARVTVKFGSKNTANNPTLNVNSTGAKNIFHNGAQITSGTNKGMLYGTVDFVYDGTQWHLVGNYVDTNTQAAYGNITNSGTITSTAVTAATGVLVYDSDNKIQRATAAQTRSIIGAGTSSFSGSYNDLSNKPTIPTVNNATLTLNVGGQAVSGNNAFTANDATNTTYNVPSATSSAYGVVKVSSVNSSAVTVNSESTIAGRYYPVELNSDGKAIVNVPWTDTDTNTTYSAGTGLQLSGTTFSTKLNSTTSLGTIGTTSKLYAVGVDANGKLCVNVPWTDTNTDTDTHYTTGLFVGATNTKSNAATANGSTYLKLYDNDTKRAEFKISGSGATTVTSDANGNIVISSTDTNTDTNTASAADNILDGSNSGTTITYAPYASATANSAWVGTDANAGKLYLGTVNPSKTTRLNYNGYLYGTKLYSGGKEVLTSHQDISGKVNSHNASMTGSLEIWDSINEYGYINLGFGYDNYDEEGCVKLTHSDSDNYTTYAITGISHKVNSNEYAYSFPTKTGTLALTSDIKSLVSNTTASGGIKYITEASFTNGVLTLESKYLHLS